MPSYRNHLRFGLDLEGESVVRISRQRRSVGRDSSETAIRVEINNIYDDDYLNVHGGSACLFTSFGCFILAPAGSLMRPIAFLRLFGSPNLAI